ncbi:MAG: hypothetical protein IT462_15970 [Planctomycetes bacterium]|nr:hypothetical protein [Planctomycetota bacterium]
MVRHLAYIIATFALVVVTGLCLASCEDPEVDVREGSTPNGQVSVYYSAKFYADGGTTPIKWFVASGNVPPGLSFTQSRRFSLLDGIPTVAGKYRFVLAVEDKEDKRASRAFEIMVYPQLVIGTNVLTTGQVDQPYSLTLQGAGGSQLNYVWTMINGTLPAGLALSPDGVLSGTPLVEGVHAPTFLLTDSAGNQVSRDFTLVIDAAGP